MPLCILFGPVWHYRHLKLAVFSDIVWVFVQQLLTIMSHMETLQTLLPVGELTLNLLEFTVSDIIDIANLLKKEPVEIFESILNDLTHNDLIKKCERAADELLISKTRSFQSN